MQDPKADFKTSIGSQEAIDLNENTWDFGEVFDVQVHLSLRLIHAMVDYT